LVIFGFLSLFSAVKISVKRARLDEIPRMVLDREVQIGFLKEAASVQELDSIQAEGRKTFKRRSGCGGSG
jgi:hypothetical protein